MGNSNFKQHYETASKTGVLQLCDCKLKDIPDEIFNLCDVLRNLDLSKNKLTCLPENIGKLKQLKHFNIENNKLLAIPDSIVNLVKLEVLNASKNHIKSLPLTLKDMSYLKKVYLNNNKLQEFPKQLIGLHNLEVLDLSSNKITEVPCGMAEFYAAELDLSENEISVIGDDLHRAPRLKVLRLDENCLNLDEIRPSLLRDSKIHTISVDGNLFEAKQLASVEGYSELSERYTAMKKKMF